MTNNELKYYESLKKKKFRDSENKFLIEGNHLVEECIKSEFYKDNIEKVFVRKDFSYPEIIKQIENLRSEIEIISLEEKTFDKLSETVNSQGVIAAINKNNNNTEEAFSNPDNSLLVALDNISDPGNLGTILRTCHWFGIAKVLISKNSADIFNSKVIRASQGAIFNLTIRQDAELEKELISFHKNRFKIFLADNKASTTLDNIESSKKPIVIVFGNESNGISENILGSDYYNKIKIEGSSACESLNVSVAVGIFLYRFRKQ